VNAKQRPIQALVVDQRTAATMLGVSVSTLRRWHREGRGPQLIRMWRLVRYRPEDLLRFLDRFESESARGGQEDRR
jgi:predicted site-specific integrase-resolvase